MPNFNGIRTTRGRVYDSQQINKIYERIKHLPIKKQAALLGTIIEESGGDPLAKSLNDTYQGLIQWGADRYRISSEDREKELNTQIDLILNTLDNTSDSKSWTHGGEGSGYKSRLDAYNIFNNDESSLEDIYRAFSYGYIRPKGKEDSYKNRLKVVQQVYNRLLDDMTYNNKSKPLNPIQENFWTQFAKLPFKKTGGQLPKAQFGWKAKWTTNYNDWIKTVPNDRKSNNYNLKRAFYLAPKEELEAWRTSSVKDLKAGKNHLNTVYKTPNGDYEFMKAKNHPTVFFEHQWYNSKDGESFRKEYEYINSNPAKYIRKKPIWQ